MFISLHDEAGGFPSPFSACMLKKLSKNKHLPHLAEVIVDLNTGTLQGCSNALQQRTANINFHFC